MKKHWFILYNISVVPLIYISLIIASLFNSKIKRGVKNRSSLFDSLKEKINLIDRSKKLIWFHSASLGEFEQAKPIIKKLYHEKEINIIVTFFSPSGYENSLKYPYADVISYLPFDTSKNARMFLEIVKPDLAVFMRYDIWPNFIWKICELNIPAMIVDATMRKNSKRKLPIIKNFHDTIYKCFNKILTVSSEDVKNFKSFMINDKVLRAVGDTRFDRVYQKSLQAKEKKLFRDNFFEGKKVFVFGSSWESDEDVILPAFEKLIKYDKDSVMIIAPHEPTLLHLEKIENTFAGIEKTIRFSYRNNYNGERIIIIDSIGILLTLYYYAEIAYVGGSFKEGIHNVLEPAVYGIPVLFGPKIEDSQEAQILVERKGGIIVHNKKEAYRTIRKLLSSETMRKKVGLNCSEYVNENIGATDKIIAEIENFIN